MAKTAKLKKRQPTVHSRAARRAVSPSDPSLSKPLSSHTRTSASPPPHPASIKPHVLAAQSAGISKKPKNKQMKRAQRLRQLKGIERAADNLDKLELKVARSVGKEKKIRERRKGWEEVNGGKKAKSGNAFEVLEENGTEERRKEWVSDEEMDNGDADMDAENEGLPVAVVGEVKHLEVVLPETVPLPVATEEDELL